MVRVVFWDSAQGMAESFDDGLVCIQSALSWACIPSLFSEWIPFSSKQENTEGKNETSFLLPEPERIHSSLDSWLLLRKEGHWSLSAFYGRWNVGIILVVVLFPSKSRKSSETSRHIFSILNPQTFASSDRTAERTAPFLQRKLLPKLRDVHL